MPRLSPIFASPFLQSFALSLFIFPPPPPFDRFFFLRARALRRAFREDGSREMDLMKFEDRVETISNSISYDERKIEVPLKRVYIWTNSQ